MATVLPPPPASADEKKDLWFEIPTTTLEEGIQNRREQEIEKGDAGQVEEDSNEFGLTRRDYEFLQWDIENEIARFDEEHGFDGIGYHDGSYVYSLSEDKVKELNERRKKVIARRKVSAQDLAIAKGLIKIRRPPTPSGKVDNN